MGDFHRLQELAADWARLWKADPQAEIFQSPEWAMAWWRAFGSRYTLCTLAVFSGDEVVGIVPLVQRDGVIQFLGTPQSDYADIICAEPWSAPVLELALKTLAQSVSGWQECVLQHLSEDSRLIRHYRELPGSATPVLHCVRTEEYQTIVVGEQQGAMFDSLLGKHHTRRRRNKAQKAGQVRFRNFATRQEAEAHFPEFFRHHVRRFAATGRHSLCATPEFCQFLKALIGELDPSERIRFGVLELDGRPLAWHFGFEVNGKFLLYQHTFDVDAAEYTPGELLVWHLLNYAKSQGMREFDFGTGDELYKKRFSNHTRQTFSVFIEPPGLAGRWRGCKRGLQSYAQPMVLRLKHAARSRATMRAFRSLRTWVTGTLAGMERAHKNSVLGQYLLRMVRDVVGNLVWSRRSIEVFASKSVPFCGTKPATAAGSQNLEVAAAGFGDLVDLAWQHPDILLPSDLPRCRKRLKKGDRAYIVREDSRVRMICWASSGAAAGVVGSAAGDDIVPDSPVVLIDQAWSDASLDLSAAYGLVLAALERDGLHCKENAPVYCGSDEPALRRELERQGFLPKFQITRYQALGRFHRESVMVRSGSGLPSSPRSA